MNNPKRYKRPRGKERRKIPDRRSGFDRRVDAQQVSKVKDVVFDTKAACEYLGISRPTFLKLIASGKIKAGKVGKGWKTHKSQLDKLLQVENGPSEGRRKK